MADTAILRSMAREVADLALRLAGLPAEGMPSDLQALSELEYLALRILKEASLAREAAVRPVGETRGMWRAVSARR